MRNGKLVDRALVAQYFPIPGSYQQYALDYCTHRTKLPKGFQAYIAGFEAMA